MKRILLFLCTGLVAFSFCSCKKLPDGNLSSLVRYDLSPLVIKQGRTESSIPLNIEGSSKPLNIKLLNVYNRETGEDMTAIFLKKYPFQAWIALHNPLIDTTIEMINVKRIDSLVYPISINPSSGQLESNATTVNLPLGKYSFDLEIENPAGKRIYQKIGEFDLIDAPPFDLPTVRATVAMKVGNESVTKSISTNVSHIKVIYLGDQEDKLIVRFLDKEGNLFNPKTEIQRRPNSGTAGGYLQTMQDYALRTTTFADRLEFLYAVMPFPLESLGNSFNYYYRIPAKFVAYDASLNLPYNTYSCNSRFSFRTFAHGTYQIDVIIPQVTRVQ